jgi:hypothetical protein
MTIMPMSPDGVSKSGATLPANTIIIKISVPSQNLQKSFRFSADEPLFHLKQQAVEKMIKGIPDVLNYGFFLHGTDGKDGKFLDEMRSASEYRLPDNVI